MIHAYYALVLECREALHRWGIAIPPRYDVHSFVRLRFLYAANADLKTLGRTLDRWCYFRNQANYDLSMLPKFASDTFAHDAIQKITTAFALLDAIDSDPARRAATIASFPP